MAIEAVQEKVRRGEYRFSEHAISRMVQRHIDRTEVEQVIMSGEIIENYPTDKYSSSCLICGQAGTGRYLHVQVSLPPTVVVITTYEPDMSEWHSFRIRRR